MDAVGRRVPTFPPEKLARRSRHWAWSLLFRHLLGKRLEKPLNLDESGAAAANDLYPSACPFTPETLSGKCCRLVTVAGW
jgi:hypothetical protein